MSLASATPEVAVRARWVLSPDRPPLRDGVLRIAGERILAVEPYREPCSPCIDLGEAMVLPGLVNAHTHLEFSDCRQPLGKRGISFAEWIGMIVRYRAERAAADPAAPARAIEEGLKESAREGVAAVGEIATQDWQPGDEARQACALLSFWEVIALAPERASDALSATERYVRAAEGQTRRAGISPHAPYTVHPRLFDQLVNLAARRGLPVAFHLAESKAELELLSTGQGDLVDSLEARGFWVRDAIKPRSRPLDYLRMLAEAPRGLVVHGNYLDAEEIAFAADCADRLSVIYCPRTHAYFGHDRYPLVELLDAGARVAVGTDSRASNPDLSVLAELRHVAAQFPEIAPQRVLELGTVAGAQALGLDSELGSLTPGKLASFCVVALHHGETEPYEALFAGRSPVIGVMHRGRWTRQPARDD